MKDIKYAFRYLRKRWVFTTVSVVIMSLGISLTATMFAIIDGAIRGGPDYEGLDRIAYVQTTIPQSQFFQSVRIHDYVDWREQQSVFDEMGVYTWSSVTLSGDGDRAERYQMSQVSASVFPLLGKQAFMGRTFTEEEDFTEGLNVALISYGMWVNRFDRDPNIVGRTIRLNARPHTVLGVMPDEFDFPEGRDVWMPLGVDPSQVERGEGRGYNVIGLLSENSSMDAARTQLTAIASRLEQQYPEANEDIVPVLSLWRDEILTDDETKSILYTMFVAVFGVLLIACANVANLLFAQTMARGKELAVRTAMGAERLRVIRQLLLESLMLSGAGAVLGIGLTEVSLRAFTRAVTELNPPAWMAFELNSAVLVFVVGITFVAALAAGLIPAIFATKSDVAGVLRDQSRGSSSRGVNQWSKVLVGIEVALSCALLVGAGLTVRSTLAVGSEDWGIQKEGLLTTELSLPGETYPDSAARFAAVERIEQEVAALPGVQSVTLSSNLPALGTGNYYYGIRGRDYQNDSEYSFAGMTTISEDFFEVMGVELAMGRTFDTRDAADGELVVIVDERFAEKNWPGEDPLGRQIRVGRSDSENPWMTVVGVVPVIRMADPESFGASPPEGMFVPARQRPMSALDVTVRTAGDPLVLAPLLRETITRFDEDIPVLYMDTLAERIRGATLQWVIIGWMFSIFGGVALILASVGLYAVMAFSVARRQTEVGVRMAMGAEPGRIIRMIMVQGSKPLLAGIVVGMALAFAMGMALSSILYGVTGTDLVTYVTIPLMLLMVSAVALLLPAGRASRIAPVVALRDD